jgi:electron transfer flavoprotein beta subunit
MKIAVCVKEVPGASSPRRHDPATKHLVREGDQVLNAFDSHAIEAALQLVESGAAGDGSTVTALCMGPAGAARTLQKALALGADDAVLVSDDALAGSDILATARVLAAAVSKGGYDLVLMGQQAGDSDCWVLPGVLAEVLGWPVLTQASSLELSGSDAQVERQTEHGYEQLAATLPAVISVSDAINTPRYPSLKAIMGAKKKPLEQLDLAAIGIDAGSVGDAGARSVVAAFVEPPAKSGGTKIEDDGTAAEQIVEFLAQKSLV